MFCGDYVAHPRVPSLIYIIKFWTWISCELNLSYSAVNSARSALSAYAQKIGGFPLGSHSEIVRHVKRIFQTKPTVPKKTSTLDVNTVFVLLKTCHPLSSLTVLQLTFKTVILLVFVLVQRAQTIALMRLYGLIWLEERVFMQMQELLKHNKVGQPLEVF